MRSLVLRLPFSEPSCGCFIVCRLYRASIPQLLMPLMGSEDLQNLLKFACTLCSSAHGGATPRVLGRQLPPPPPQGASSRQLVVKGMSPRSQRALLWEGAVRTVGSHLGRIPNCSEVPDPPPPREPREQPSPAPLPEPPPPGPPPPPPPP